MTAPIDTESVRTVLRDVIDPEVGVNIVDLGLVYGIDVQGENVSVQLTMTSPACPLGEYLVDDAARRLRDAFPSIQDVKIDLVWDPPWTPERMTPSARRELGWND